MMPRTFAVCWCLVASLLFLLAAGCGGGDGPEPEETTSEDVALDVKYLALECVQATRRSTQAGRNALSMLLEYLEEGFDSGLAGEHADTCNQVFDCAKNLQGLYERSASKAQIDQEVSNLAALAEKLPGDASTLEEEEEVEEEDD